jgi:hypothetical protein
MIVIPSISIKLNPKLMTTKVSMGEFSDKNRKAFAKIGID